MPKPTFFNLPDHKRQLILDLAIAEFAQNDYHNASISRIVAQAGIAKGSFYQYFGDKQELYLYLLELAAQEKSRLLHSQPPPQATADLFTLIRWLWKTGLTFEFSNPQLAQITYRAVYGDAPLPTETLAILKRGAQTYFQTLVAQGITAGTIRPEIDPEAAAFVLHAIFTNLGDYLIQRHGGDPAQLLTQSRTTFASLEAEQFLEQILTLLAHGIAMPQYQC